MPKRPNSLELRGSKWRTRLSVLKELRSIVGARELVESHKKSDYQTALELHETKIIEFRNRIRAARRKLGNETWLGELREGEIKTILYEWMHQLEKTSLARIQKHVDIDDEEVLEDLLYTLGGDLENVSHDLRSHNAKAWKRRHTRTCRKSHDPTPRNSPQR